MAKFKKIEDHEYVVSVWFERDRKNISLSTPNGREIFSLWDDDVDQAISDGFLTVPRHPRPSEADWQPHAVAYARYYDLI